MVSSEMLALGSKRFVIRDIFTEVQKRKAILGPDQVFDFSIGNPNVPAPPQVALALQDAMEELSSMDLNGYSNASGFEDVKQIVVDYANKTFDMSYETKDLFLTCGAAAALVIALRALVNPGEEVVVLAPHYPEYPSFIQSAQGKTVIVSPDLENFQINFPALEAAINENTKAVLVNSPNNPSGAIYTEETIVKLTDLLQARAEAYGHPIYIVSDEPYREIVFDDLTVPYIPKYYKDTLICYSYSKSLSIPGHRVGYLLMPYESSHIEQIRPCVSGAARILGFVQAPAPAQRIVAACVDVTADMKLYETNRDVFYNGLTALGFTCVKPQGAFYLMMKSPLNSMADFVAAGKKHELFYAPCEDFGCPGYVRMSFCVATKTIEDSLVQFAKLATDLGLAPGKE